MAITATHATGLMIQRFDLEHAASILRREGLILAPTDSLWSIICDAQDPVALERLRRLRPPSPDHPIEVLFPNLDTLKRYAPFLHPRLETLLSYHARPLTVVTRATDSLPRPVISPDGLIAARIAQDSYCQQLLQFYGRPLASVLAHVPGTPYPTHFGRVRSDIIEAVDYVAKYRPREATNLHPSVMVRLGENEELDFIRE
ncbi:MAG: Sua5/YciO/YrdC/YwlC family protein [Lewinella sp.]|nr:Sua5/YciO/YrdC/YwlC family protein [Lewinella sp.]